MAIIIDKDYQVTAPDSYTLETVEDAIRELTRVKDAMGAKRPVWATDIAHTINQCDRAIKPLSRLIGANGAIASL